MAASDGLTHAAAGLASATARDWRLGTIGYSYPGWSGVFFPKRLPRERWLEYYASQFPAVELNTTFHATPSPDRLRAWADCVPDGFRFSVKVDRRITHDTPLDRTPPILQSFLTTMQSLGTRLGCLVFQFPPSMHIDQLPALDRLLGHIPPTIPVAVELRSDSWLHGETWDLLRRHRAAAVALEHEDHPRWRDVPITSSFAYVRIVGKHGRFDTDDRELFDPTSQLRPWATRLVSEAAVGQSPLWVMFNNDFAGHAPATLRKFARLTDIPLPEGPPRQRTLFDDER